LYSSEDKYKQFTKEWPLQTISQNKCQLCKENKVTCEVLLMYQTKWFGLSAFLLFLHLPVISSDNREFTVVT
jgi:hypothetical protein